MVSSISLLYVFLMKSFSELVVTATCTVVVEAVVVVVVVLVVAMVCHGRAFESSEF